MGCGPHTWNYEQYKKENINWAMIFLQGFPLLSGKRECPSANILNPMSFL